jgi:hypothetical protein
MGLELRIKEADGEHSAAGVFELRCLPHPLGEPWNVFRATASTPKLLTALFSDRDMHIAQL